MPPGKARVVDPHTIRGIKINEELKNTDHAGKSKGGIDMTVLNILKTVQRLLWSESVQVLIG